MFTAPDLQKKCAEMKTVVYYPTVIETQLSEDLLPDDTSMKCDDISSFPISGVVKIEDEYIKYNSKDNTSFSGLTHGDFGSVAVHHVAEYVYNETGFHRITLKVTDNDGMSTTYSQIVNIRNMMPNPSDHWYMQKLWILRVWQWIIAAIIVAIIVKKL